MVIQVLCRKCKKEIKWENNPFRPFCSERCKLIDLGQWAEEKYRIPGEKVKDQKEEAEEKDREKK